MPRRALLSLPLLALVIAGCGETAPTSQTPPATPQAKTAGPTLSNGGTDLRLGGAITDDGTGARKLAGKSRPDPDRLRRSGRRIDGVGAGDTCPDQDLQPTGANVDQVVASTLCLLNGQRADAGLGPLAQNGQLAQAAMVHSQDMVAASYFSHTGKDGSSSTDRIRAAGYIPTDKAWTVGENLAWGTGNLATPRNIVAAWMNSQGHRENILRPAFNEIGFGVVTGNPSQTDGAGATYTTTFGSLGGSATDAPTGAPATPVTTAPAPDATGSQAVKSAKKTSRKRKARRHRARIARAKSARRKAARARIAKGSR